MLRKIQAGFRHFNTVCPLFMCLSGKHMDWECLRTSAEKNMGMGGRMLVDRREERRSNAEREADFSVIQMSKEWVVLTSTSPIRPDNT